MRSIFLCLALGACTTSPGDPSADPGTDGSVDRPDAGNDGKVDSSSIGGAQDGARLKVRSVTTPDGAIVPLGWRDSTLGLDCAFEVASDGKLRCLPMTPFYSSGKYADAACTIPE